MVKSSIEYEKCISPSLEEKGFVFVSSTYYSGPPIDFIDPYKNLNINPMFGGIPVIMTNRHCKSRNVVFKDNFDNEFEAITVIHHYNLLFLNKNKED